MIRALTEGVTRANGRYAVIVGFHDPELERCGVYGGLTCVLAESRTREAVFDAIKARCCYGVTAAQRIHVELFVNGLPMVAAGRAEGPVKISGHVVGTGPIERVDIFRGLTHIRIASPYVPESFEGSQRYRIAWAGSRVRRRNRLTTGMITLSYRPAASSTP